MDKGQIYGPGLRRSKESFYNFTIKMVLKNHQGTISSAKLRLDGHGERELRRQLRVYLSRELGPGVIKDLKFKDSSRDVLVQLVDMVAGSIRLAHDEDDWDYRNIIEPRLEDIWVFGRKKSST